MSGTIFAPFSVKQITHLNARQRDRRRHAYTCLTHSTTPLVADREGLRCPADDCDYRQNWADSADTVAA